MLDDFHEDDWMHFGSRAVAQEEVVVDHGILTFGKKVELFFEKIYGYR